MTTLQDTITAFQAILVRNDCTTAQATNFIQMAQTRIERTLRTPGQETIGTITGNANAPTNSIVLPNDFLALKLMYTQGTWGGMELMEYRSAATFFTEQRRSMGGVSGLHPKYYTRIGSSLMLTPPIPAGQEIWMNYYAAQPMLVNPTDSNFFTVSAQDILVYAALSFAADFFVDDRTAAFEGRFNQLMGDLAEQARETDMSQSDMAIAPAHGDY
jgi:hypothetical protein